MRDRWRIVYPDLFVRVLAHMSREPLLVRTLLDGGDPVEAVRARLGLPDLEQAYAVLVWMALGMDGVNLSRRHPLIFSALPDDLAALRPEAERAFSVLALALIQIREDHIRNRGTRTLYQRFLPWRSTLEMAEVYEHRFLGSVEDLIDVCCAALWQNEEGAEVWNPEVDPLDRTVSISGHKRKAPKAEWDRVLRTVAELRNPLSVPLNPTVLWGA